jgi:hypothetical protein
VLDFKCIGISGGLEFKFKNIPKLEYKIKWGIPSFHIFHFLLRFSFMRAD